eukprot:TRINITY_DN4693_c0_g2_i3.p1 TRINITY_DN4693_c0_g2~~TRINITY_DN4693_c0_g2_i3.p1  ORF type:complete len:183 (+),score=44.44 TRINITY_DN4693_c0_g2_i3:64-612(+)
MEKPQRPNILITGTPGTGKTTLSEEVSRLTSMRHVNISQLVKEKQLYEEYDAEFDTYIIDEDKVCDELEDQMVEGFNVVDHHGCDFFPQRWFDLVVVLKSTTENLYDRLVKRGYTEKKVNENMECEIMQVVEEEARESYEEEVVVVLDSNSPDDVASNAERIHQWLLSHVQNHYPGMKPLES